MDALENIFTRRSVPRLVEPAPSSEDLEKIMRAAVSAPDHGELRPWKFVILEGESKARFGDLVAEALAARAEAAGEVVEDPVLEAERKKLERAPMVIIVAAVASEGRIPWQEQLASGAAAAQNLCLAAHALGYGAMWRTGDMAYDPAVKDAIGLRVGDEIVGFIYLGSIPEGYTPKDKNVDPMTSVEYWSQRRSDE